MHTNKDHGAAEVTTHNLASEPVENLPAACGGTRGDGAEGADQDGAGDGEAERVVFEGAAVRPPLLSDQFTQA